MLKNVVEPIVKTYMLAITKCGQTEYEKLSAAQIILEKFHDDYPKM